MVAVLTATISPVGADASLARPASVRLAAAFQTPDFAITQYDVTLSDAGGGAFAAPPNLGGAGLASELVGGRSLAPRAGLELDGRSEMLIVDPGHEATLAFRSQTAGRWSDWLTLETPLDEAPDGLPGEEGSLKPSTAIGPIWIGEGAERVEFVGLEGNVERVSVEALASLDLDNAGPPVGAALPGQPTIQPRSAWATKGFATQNEGCEDGPQPATNIRAAIVHHTVTGNDYAIGAVDDMLRAIYRLHVDINGWCDIAYNFVVDRFGNIWQARSGDLEAPIIGGHARGFNTWTVGIALLGQHQPGASPAAASSAMAAGTRAARAWSGSGRAIS